MRMITPVTARKGVDMTNSGIRTCSFSAGDWTGLNDEVAASHCDDLHDTAGSDLGVGCGSHVVRSAGKADQNGSEVVGGDPDRYAPCRPDHVLEVEG